MEAKRIGGLYDDNKRHQAGSVWDKEQISPTIDTMQGGNREPMIIEDCLGGINYKVSDDFQKGYLPNMARSILANNDGAACIVAMRGRNPDNPSDRTVGAKTEQRLEPNSQGICNTLTSVQKDNLVLEQQGISTKGKKQEVASTILAGYERTNMTGFNADNAVLEKAEVKNPLKGKTDYGWHFEQNVYEQESIVRTIKSESGSGNIPKVIENQEHFKTAIRPVVKKVGQISEGSQCGTVVSENGIAPNLVAGTHGYANNHIHSQYRIRKLTPKECWRLMGFTDEDFISAKVGSRTLAEGIIREYGKHSDFRVSKVAEKQSKMSNSQLYKQAGNSIVKNVLIAIFGQMIEGKENIYKEI